MTIDQAAQSLRIPLEQLVRAKATCEGCEHRKPGESPVGTNCCQKPGGGCNKFVRFNAACPVAKWDNRSHVIPRPPLSPSETERQKNIRKLAYIEALNRRGIKPGDPVLTKSERAMLNDHRAGRL